MGQGRATSASDIRIIVERPEFLLLDGDEENINEHERSLNERVLDIDVFLADKGASTATIRFDNTDLFMFFMSEILPGNAWWIKITANDHIENPTAISTRRFRIQKVSGYTTIKVKLVSAEADLNIKKDNKISYPDATVHEAVMEVGRRNGLIPALLFEEPNTGSISLDAERRASRRRAVERDFITPTAAKYPSLPQSKESDAKFLTRMAAKVGYVWWVEEETRPTATGRVGKLRRSLRFMPRTFNPEIRPIAGVIDGLHGGTISQVIGDPEFEIDYESNVFFGHGGTNNFWSPVKKKFSEISNDLKEIEDAAAGQMTPVDPENQVDLASTTETFLQRKEEADKLLAAFESALITVKVRMVGNWDLEPRRLVRFVNFGFVVNGLMWIDSIRHTASRSGIYQMELTLRANAMDLSPRDVLNLTSKISNLQERFREFEDEVLFKKQWSVGSDNKIKYERYRVLTPQEAEEFARGGHASYYKHWLNANFKR